MSHCTYSDGVNLTFSSQHKYSVDPANKVAHVSVIDASKLKDAR
jgi:hypothetical protein